MIDAIKSLVKNEWVIGIVTGLIGSLTLILVTYIVSKLQRKSTYKKANNECVEILLKYIDKNGIPSDKIIVSVFNVVADRYGIKSEKLDIKKVKDNLMVLLIEQSKYSPQKSKKFLTDIESIMTSVIIKPIDIREIVAQDQLFNEVMSCTIDSKKDIFEIIYDILKLVVFSAILILQIRIRDSAIMYIALASFVLLTTASSIIKKIIILLVLN